MAAPNGPVTPTFNLDLGLNNTHVLVTGAFGLIGRVMVHAFVAAGCRVSAVDLPGDIPWTRYVPNLRIYFADVTSDIDDAFTQAEAVFGPVECCIALASVDLSSLPQTESICDLDPNVWRKVIDTNVTGTFLTCQRWLQGIRRAMTSTDPTPSSPPVVPPPPQHLPPSPAHPPSPPPLRNVSLIIMGSVSGTFGQRTMAAYAAGKSAVQHGLLQSLALDAPRIHPRARVNAVAPGAVDTPRFRHECAQFGSKWMWETTEAT